ncbi:MAG: hypothetical protein DMD81_20035 [Candidatus Rokuibacteriota bacterium]|nr:MAG: hypothetical protein DMD81_20035 [Candidatus Rokubacteria bacterium]
MGKFQAARARLLVWVRDRPGLERVYLAANPGHGVRQERAPGAPVFEARYSARRPAASRVRSRVTRPAATGGRRLRRAG